MERVILQVVTQVVINFVLIIIIELRIRSVIECQFKSHEVREAAADDMVEKRMDLLFKMIKTQFKDVFVQTLKLATQRLTEISNERK